MSSLVKIAEDKIAPRRRSLSLASKLKKIVGSYYIHTFEPNPADITPRISYSIGKIEDIKYEKNKITLIVSDVSFRQKGRFVIHQVDQIQLLGEWKECNENENDSPTLSIYWRQKDGPAIARVEFTKSYPLVDLSQGMKSNYLL